MGNELTLKITTGMMGARAFDNAVTEFGATWQPSEKMDNMVDVGGKNVWVDDAALAFLKERELVAKAESAAHPGTSPGASAHVAQAGAGSMIVLKEAGLLVEGEQIAKVGG